MNRDFCTKLISLVVVQSLNNQYNIDKLQAVTWNYLFMLLVCDCRRREPPHAQGSIHSNGTVLNMFESLAG